MARSRQKPKGFWRIRHMVIMYYLYILLNEAKNRTYTGVADDVEKRLKEHNAGGVKSSSPYRPYKVIHTESFVVLTNLSDRNFAAKAYTSARYDTS